VKLKTIFKYQKGNIVLLVAKSIISFPFSAGVENIMLRLQEREASDCIDLKAIETFDQGRLSKD
jgi:hypothetical protein